MGLNNGIITAPVGVDDVRRALGVGTTDIGICSSEKINMWAKYKPVIRANVVDTITTQWDETNKKWKSDATWFKADDGNFGITLDNNSTNGAAVDVQFSQTGMINALTTLATRIDGDKNGWKYTRPSGGWASPLRLPDFALYRHGASRPIKKVSTNEYVYASSNEAYDVTATMIKTEWGSDISSRDYIVPTDITYIKNLTSSKGMYVCMAIYKNVNGVKTAIAWVVPGDDTFTWRGAGIVNSDQTDGVIYNADAYATTKLKNNEAYYVLPFLCTSILAQPADGTSKNIGASGHSVITIPGADFASFIAKQRATTQTIGQPGVSTNEIIGSGVNFGIYRAYATMDATSSAYSGGTARFTVAVVNELFSGTFSAGTYGWVKQGFSYTVTNGQKSNIVYIDTSDTSFGPGLDVFNHTYRVLIIVNEESTSILLKQPAIS